VGSRTMRNERREARGGRRRRISSFLKLSWRKDEGLSKGEGGLSGGGKGSVAEETKSVGGREWLFD
jgi:hypothetical protein